ncbi:MAG: metallophosphoesterase [Lachnospiraceae bacterium]|nr:metallophosphoesterase [Lachnospiraceae bacterium]
MKYLIAIIISIAVVLFIINIVDLNRYVVRSVAIFDPKVKKKLKVCFVSDLHNYSVTPKFYDDIKEYNPDLILCGGDTITATPKKKQTHAYEFLKELSKIAPVITGMGNHEYRAKIYRKKYGDMYDEFERKAKEYNVEIITNGSRYFEENNICVSGVEIDRMYYKKFRKIHMDDSYIESLLGKVNTDRYNILLAHNPDYFDNYSEYGSDLTLSGHVHGGLIRLPFIGGIAHPGIRFFPKFSGGAYNEKGKHIPYADSYVSSQSGIIRMLVSCGIGYHTLTLRLFNPGELIFVTIDTK